MVSLEDRSPTAPTGSAVHADDDVAVRLRQAITRLFRRIERTRAGAALTPSASNVLATIVRAGPIRLSELAIAEAMNPTMLSRVVRHLEQAGLVTRRADDIDRRAAHVAATPAGRRLQERIRNERSDALSAALAALSAEELTTIEAGLCVLERLAEQLKGRRP